MLYNYLDFDVTEQCKNIYIVFENRASKFARKIEIFIK